MPKPEKIQKVSALKERLSGAEALVITDYRGLTVSEESDVRRSLREAGAQFTIVKNSLFRLAADEAGLGELKKMIDGPTAVTFVMSDPVAASKSLLDASRRYPSLVLRGAYVEGRFLSGEQAQALATLEAREVVLAKLAGVLKGEMTRAASIFQALQGRFLSLVEALKDRAQQAEPVAQPEPEPAREPAPTPEPAPEAAAESEPQSEAPEEEIAKAEEPSQETEKEDRGEE
ncbi:MAG: 50S ribosomal protein L10 [Actinomycetota bacterium]